MIGYLVFPFAALPQPVHEKTAPHLKLNKDMLRIRALNKTSKTVTS